MPESRDSLTVKRTVDPAVEFVRDIGKKDSVLIVFGHDNDSICSASILYKLLKKHITPFVELYSTQDNFSVSEADADSIAQKKVDNVIVVDIAHLASEKVVGTLAAAHTLIIDHHQPLSLKNIVYCNPRVFDKKIYMPVSYIAYKIYEKISDPGEVVWMSAVGTLSDHAVGIAPDLFARVIRDSPRLVGNTRLKEEDLFSFSTLGAIAKIFDSARIVRGREGSILAAKVMCESKSYEDIMKSGSADAQRLVEWSDVVKNEFKRLVQDFNRKRKLIKPDTIFYEIESKLMIKSTLSGYLAQFYKDKVLVISQKVGDNLDVSFRRGDMCKTDLNELAKKAVRGIPGGEGGGHEAASGARIPAKYMTKFIKQL